MRTRRINLGHLLAAPGRAKARRNVALDLAGGRIAAVTSATPRGRARGLLALPAMINAHDHGYGVRPLAFGAADDALECWIAAWAGRPQVDPWLEAAVAFARMAGSGIGATVHCHNSLTAERLPDEAAGVARAAADIGIRVAFSCPILDRNAWVYGGPEALLPHLSPADARRLTPTIPSYTPAARQLEIADEIADRHDGERFQVQYGPIGPQWCEDATLAAIAEASARNGRRVHMHLLESPRQRQWLDARYPGGIVAHLDAIGLLSPRLTVAHGVWLQPAECALLAARGVTVAVNTASNLRLRSGLAPVARFIAHGLDFAIGLDGGALDDDEDYLSDLRLAWRLHDGTGLEHAITPGRLFEAVHDAGRRVVGGRARDGRLRVGAPADILVLDHAAMAQDLIDDAVEPLDVLLARMTRRHVDRLVVAGRDVVRDGRVIGLDLAEAEAELTARAGRLGPSPARRALTRRQREAVRRYYASDGHRGGGLKPSR